MAKTRYLPLFFLVLLLVQSCVTEDQDWMFYGRGPFKLSVDLALDRPVAEITYSVKRDLDLMDPSAEPIFRQKLLVRAEKDGMAHAKLSLGKLEPGFYQITVCDTMIFNIGVNPERIQSPADPPEDFDAFWATTLSELAEVPMEVKWTLLPEHSSEKRECYRVEMPSLGGAAMGGIIFIPTAEGRYPVRLS